MTPWVGLALQEGTDTSLARAALTGRLPREELPLYLRSWTQGSGLAHLPWLPLYLKFPYTASAQGTTVHLQVAPGGVSPSLFW
jgi:hypothetical protein